MESIRYYSISKMLSAIFVLILVLAACAPASAPLPPGEYRDAPALEEMGAPVEAMPEMEKVAGEGNFQSAPADIERLVIKNADLSIVVDDTNASVDRISRMAEELGGYVHATDMYPATLENGAEVLRGTMTIRVPAEKMNQALERIKAESNQDPTSEKISSQDVTSEYTDLESRLRNLEAAEKELQRIMESAVKTEDVLNVYNQLVQVRGEIEIIKGQMKYYEQSAAMSAINIELIPNEAVQPLTIGGWQPGGVVKEALQSLINGLQTIVEVLIWVIIKVIPTLVVFFVIFILPFILIFRWLWRRSKRRKEAAAKETTTE